MWFHLGSEMKTSPRESLPARPVTHASDAEFSFGRRTSPLRSLSRGSAEQTYPRRGCHTKAAKCSSVRYPARTGQPTAPVETFLDSSLPVAGVPVPIFLPSTFRGLSLAG